MSEEKKEKLTHKQRLFCHQYILQDFNGTAAALQSFDIEGKEILTQEAPELEYIDDIIDKPIATAESVKTREHYFAEIKRVENTAASIAREYIRKPQIVKEISRLLDRAGFNEDSVKIEHAKVIKQDYKLAEKMKGIQEFYKLKGSYSPEKIEHTIITEEDVKAKIANLK